jgi:hypothetical protein
MTLQDFQQTISRFVDGRRQRRRSQIEPLVAGCADSRGLLDQMLARLGIDAAELSVEDLRDMTWTCTTCPDKRHCRKWLEDTENTDFHGFCPNAAQLDRALWSSHRTPPTGGSFHPSADDLTRMNAEARRREVRALLHMAP